MGQSAKNLTQKFKKRDSENIQAIGSIVIDSNDSEDEIDKIQSIMRAIRNNSKFSDL